MYIDNPSSKTLIQYCTFSKNIAIDGDGMLLCFTILFFSIGGGVMLDTPHCILDVEHSLFFNNTADMGGGSKHYYYLPIIRFANFQSTPFLHIQQ